MSEELPNEIARLLKSEAESYPEDAALKASVQRRVESAITLGFTANRDAGARAISAATTAKGVAAPLVALIGVGAFVAGTALGVSMQRPAPAPAVSAMTIPSAPTSITPIASSAEEAPLPVASSTSIAPARSASVPTVDSDPVNRGGDLVRERELLDVARAALAHGDPDGAIAAAKRHARLWPHGVLAEERDVVWIQALVAEGNHDEAVQLANVFRKQFPNSALSGAVKAALGESNSSSAVTEAGAP